MNRYEQYQWDKMQAEEVNPVPPRWFPPVISTYEMYFDAVEGLFTVVVR